MMNRKQKNQIKLLLLAAVAMASSTALAQTAPPPSLGQDTKGVPAVEETAAETPKEVPSASDQGGNEATTTKKQKKGGPLGTATIKESRRESGQVYLIELEHSSGAKQYIEETDSDGTIESIPDGVDDTPNLPKWKLGSW